MKKIIIAVGLVCTMINISGAAFAADKAEQPQAMEISKRAAKMKIEEMKGHEKIGSISGEADTRDDLEDKFASAATMMGAKYFVITSLQSKSHAFGTANLYK